MGLSLEERKKKLMEECAACAAGGGASLVGDNGFEGSADSEGPHAGYDPLLKKALKKLKKDKKVEEGYEPLPVNRMKNQIKKKEERSKTNMNIIHGNRKLLAKYKADAEFYSPHKTTKDQDFDQARVIDYRKGELKKSAQQIKRINQKLRNHDSVDSRFKELENRERHNSDFM